MTAGAMAMAVGSVAITTMSMPAINFVAVHWAGGLGGQQQNSIVTEDDDEDGADMEVGEYMCNFLEVGLHQL